MSMIQSAQTADYVLMAKCLTKAGGSLSLAAQYADQSSNGFRVPTVLRSAISAGSVADAGWAGNLVDHALIAAGFVETLQAARCLLRSR